MPPLSRLNGRLRLLCEWESYSFIFGGVLVDFFGAGTSMIND